MIDFLIECTLVMIAAAIGSIINNKSTVFPWIKEIITKIKKILNYDDF